LEDGSKIFSRAALDKLRSPEKLDTLLPITTPLTWMALAAVALLLFSIILWSIFGSFTVKAEGVGMIMDAAGVVNVTHTQGGRIKEIAVHPGSRISQDELIARVELPEQVADETITKHSAELSTNKDDTMERVYRSDTKEYQGVLAKEIRSVYNGEIDKIFVRVGQFVPAGLPICSVRLTEGREDLTGVFYIPLDKGKRVEVGQTIQLAPNGVDISLAGSLIGVVRSVSEYPVTLQSIENEIGNPQLAQMILSTSNNAVMEVKFDLVKDENSESGYLWTSFVGEHKKVSAGSFCKGSIIIERRPPIEKVFYKLSQWLRSN
jgi:biotin carboxyl carrier protein